VASWRNALKVLDPKWSCAGAVTPSQRLGNIDHAVAREMGTPGSPLRLAN